MRPIDDFAELSPDQRLREVFHILGVGVLRLHNRGAQAKHLRPTPKNSRKSGPEGLEVSSETVLSVHNG